MTPTVEESELIAAAQDGERDAFDELVRATFVDTYTLARRLTGNEEDAADVTQDAYLRAWRAMPKFRAEAKFSTWMYRITANAAATLTDKRRRHRAEPLDEARDAADESAGMQPADVVERLDATNVLSAALDELPAKLRAVVLLKDVYDLPHEEIAQELGISVSAAKVRLHRGRKRLRDLLYEDEEHAHAV